MTEKVGDGVFQGVTQAEVINTVQYFGATSEDVTCPVIRKFCERLPHDSGYVLDSRVSMLKPGWYPSIPGWHHDEVVRKADGTLDYSQTDSDKVHYMSICDFGTGSLTQFCDAGGEFDSYTALNKAVEACEEKAFTSVKSGELWRFPFNSTHRAVPATGSGWRLFVRATYNSQRIPERQIRTQTQVYLTATDRGW